MTEKMTNETEQLRRLVDAREMATKGPWERDDGYIVSLNNQEKIVTVHDWCTDETDIGQRESDAEFIALSGTLDLRAILTRMEKMEAALKPFADAATEAEKWGGAAESVIANSVSLSDCKRAKEAFEWRN